MSKKRFKNRSTSPQNIEVDSDSESVLTPEPEQEELEEEEVLKDGGKGSKALRGSFFVDGWWDGYFHSCLASSESVALYSAWSAPRTRGRGRGRVVAATPSSPPPQADSPEHMTSRVDSCEVDATRSPIHEPQVDEPQVDEPSTHETRVPEASFHATPEQSRDEGTSPETQWDTWAEPSGHADSVEELGEGATV
ncbi:hypothetical protein ZWY2020_033043 [Hordeum vulgare]|nr:hypothetical protein ZWY2020_033043 [Hordeum vulgare]